MFDGVIGSRRREIELGGSVFGILLFVHMFCSEPEPRKGFKAGCCWS